MKDTNNGKKNNEFLPPLPPPRSDVSKPSSLHGEGRSAVTRGGGEGETDDVIVATQTLAQLSVARTHAEASVLVTTWTNIRHQHLSGISLSCR